MTHLAPSGVVRRGITCARMRLVGAKTRVTGSARCRSRALGPKGSPVGAVGATRGSRSIDHMPVTRCSRARGPRRKRRPLAQEVSDEFEVSAPDLLDPAVFGLRVVHRHGVGTAAGRLAS